jgi:hypothetical protein
MTHSQSIQERLRTFSTTFAQGYMGPFADAFGASLNSGWYSNADASTGLDLYLGVKIMGMPVPDGSKNFSIASIYNGTITDAPPTVFGDKDTDVPIGGLPPASGPDWPKNYPRGLGLSLVPMAVPQAQIGNIFGTRLVIRYLPTMSLGDYGDFSFFGVGIQHSISQYIPLVPVDLSVLGAYTSLTVGSLVTTKALTFGAQVSKSLPVVTLYGGLAWEKSTMTLSYDAVLPDPTDAAHTRTLIVPVGFDMDGKNNFRATVGVSFSLLIIKINADYSFASQPVAVIGIGIGI